MGVLPSSNFPGDRSLVVIGILHLEDAMDQMSFIVSLCVMVIVSFILWITTRCDLDERFQAAPSWCPTRAGSNKGKSFLPLPTSLFALLGSYRSGPLCADHFRCTESFASTNQHTGGEVAGQSTSILP